MNNKKVYVIAAVNGGLMQDREGAIVPTSPQEIADEAYRCHEAGAAVVHIHARDAKKAATGSAEVFRDIIQRIRDKCDILIQTTNGIGSRTDPVTGEIIRPTEQQRLSLIDLDLGQDLYSVAGGSWDFYHPATPDNQFAYTNSPTFVKKYISTVSKRGAALEFEIAQISFLDRFRRLADEGLFDPKGGRYWLNYCLGFGGLRSTPADLAQAVTEGRALFPDAKWEVTATHKDQFSMNTLGVMMGCDFARVGFEDNIYLPSGKPAQRNYQLVEAMVRIAREFGREPGTVAEARQAFGRRT